MNEEDLLYKIEALFREAGKAHHQAFINTDGTDPEWPLWYADYLLDKLGRLLNAHFTKSELIYLIVSVDKEMSLMAPGADWPSYYATFFVNRYS
ncbi:MAG: hypothetical protein WBD99_09440 [Thermodesulfobacteriota bacterium]